MRKDGKMRIKDTGKTFSPKIENLLAIPFTLDIQEMFIKNKIVKHKMPSLDIGDIDIGECPLIML